MLRPISALVAAVALVLTTLPATQADPADGPDGSGRPDRLPAQGSPEAAQQALERAEALFAGGGRAEGRAGDRTGDQPTTAHGREATLALRDLVLARPQLRGEDRERADAILARPTDGAADPQGDGYTTQDVKRACPDAVCVHWVEETADAVPATDDDGNGRPDYVDSTLAALGNVHDTYTGAGYQPPLPDGEKGGGPQTDVYLADIGDDGLYGYCTSDETGNTDYTTWAYCVLDDDYANSQYGTRNTPLDNMRVTAAHEYFHAVQFGYDFLEDSWFMESTATWAEDELYDRVDDNVAYLADSPLTKPRRPLDDSLGPDGNVGMQVYGDWIFSRYLTERWPDSEGGMPTLVRDAWRRADSEGADDYSLRAFENEVTARGGAWPDTFARFAEAGRRSRQVYDEGRAQSYPVAPLAGRATLTPADRASSWRTARLDHLTSATYRFVPGETMTRSDWRIRLRLDMAPTARGSSAIATVHHRDKAPTTHVVRLDGQGDGSRALPFSRGSVKAVEVTMANTSTRTSGCWQDPDQQYSCWGTPTDDDLDQKVRGIAFR